MNVKLLGIAAFLVALQMIPLYAFRAHHPTETLNRINKQIETTSTASAQTDERLFNSSNLMSLSSTDEKIEKTQSNINNAERY